MKSIGENIYYKKILIEMHHGLGDIIQILPLIANLRRNFPGSKISLIISRKSDYELINAMKLVDKFYFFNSRRMSYFEIIKLMLDIKKEKYNIAFLSHISHKLMGVFLLLCGCERVVGETNESIISKKYIGIKIDPNMHRVDRNLELLKGIGIKVFEYNPYLKIPNYFYKRTIEINEDKPIIGICIGTNPVEKRISLRIREKYNVKQWNIDNFIKIIEKLANNNFSIMLIGGKKEEIEIENYLPNLTNKRIVNCINKTTILESAAILNKCNVVVGCDTGMLHVADALGKKTITIFGPTNPQLVGPYSNNAKYVTANIACQYCYDEDRLFECFDRKCLNSITVERVYSEILNAVNDIEMENIQ